MRTDRLLLQDILDPIAEIEEYLPQSEDEFLANPPVESHILRHIQIIGEASSRLSVGVKIQHPHVPWTQIVGMRNVTIHDYAGINWHRVFQTAHNDVPVLKPQIETILRAVPGDKQP